MNKTIWISFDLGIKSDYDGLYAWLDNKNAKECGNNLAVLKVELNQLSSIKEEVKQDLEGVSFGKRDRVYIIWREGKKVKGSFIIGGRKSSPWQGYGHASNVLDSDDSDDLL